MKRIHLNEVHSSLYFWPGVTLSAIAVFFSVWAVLISGGNWAGQAVWASLATVLAALLLTMAVRGSRHSTGSPQRLAL
jgi:hypothetical protein